LINHPERRRVHRVFASDGNRVEGSCVWFRLKREEVDNPYITITGAADKPGVAFTTAQRAIERLERSGIVKPASKAKRDRVYCAEKLLQVLEEPIAPKIINTCILSAGGSIALSSAMETGVEGSCVCFRLEREEVEFPGMFDRRYFVYMIQSSSRRALYIGFTNFLTMRVIEHRRSEYPGSFTSRYRTWRLVYYEEFGDAEAAKDRERQLKGWSRAKKNALVAKINPKWRDLISEWESKYRLEFRLDGQIVEKQPQQQTQDPSTPVSRARPTSANSLRSRGPGNPREPSSAQD